MRVTIIEIKPNGRTPVGGIRWKVRYLVGASPTISTIKPHTEAAGKTVGNESGKYDIELNGRNQIVDISKA